MNFNLVFFSITITPRLILYRKISLVYTHLTSCFLCVYLIYIFFSLHFSALEIPCLSRFPPMLLATTYTLIFLIVLYGQLLFALMTRRRDIGGCDIGGRRRCHVFSSAHSIFLHPFRSSSFNRPVSCGLASSACRRSVARSPRVRFSTSVTKSHRGSYSIPSRFSLQTNDFTECIAPREVNISPRKSSFLLK